MRGFKIDHKATELYLSHRQLCDEQVEEIAVKLQDANMALLDLSWNNISDTGAAELAKYLPETSVTSLDLSKNQLGPEGAKALLNINMTELNLSENNIGVKGAVAIADALPQASLVSLNLSKNQLGLEGAAALKIFLPKAKNLSKLSFYFNNIGDLGVANLAKVLPNTNLRELDLDGNNIGDTGAIALAKALPNTNLSELYLDSNNIGNLGAVELAKVLPNTNLRELDLGYNNIGNLGAVGLAKVLPRTSLRELELDNNNINDEGELLILVEAINNPFFLTKIYGLRNSAEINAVVDANSKRLAIRAKAEGQLAELRTQVSSITSIVVLFTILALIILFKANILTMPIFAGLIGIAIMCDTLYNNYVLKSELAAFKVAAVTAVSLDSIVDSVNSCLPDDQCTQTKHPPLPAQKT
jgi:Ran GTPase-activating protein (RanGAP) involved in mRNA processing and transport